MWVGFEYARRVASVDVPNLVRYGRRSPRWAQRIWVDPAAVELAVFGLGNDRSASVVAGWLAHAEPFAELPKVRAAVEHWDRGVPWAATGVYDHVLALAAASGSYDGCRNREEVVERYRRIDEVFEQVRRERRLRTRRELTGRWAFRELGGVRIHLGPSGPVFGGSGHHRLAMAKVLGLRRIPAQLGVIDPAALATWRERFRGEELPAPR